jgi:hypothetical protein
MRKTNNCIDNLENKIKMSVFLYISFIIIVFYFLSSKLQSFLCSYLLCISVEFKSKLLLYPLLNSYVLQLNFPLIRKPRYIGDWLNFLDCTEFKN